MSDKPCKLFTGKLNNNGYGYINVGTEQVLAHRLAWMLAHGLVIPRGMVVMHSCDVRNCIEPTHLSVGTQQDNIKDTVKKGRCTRAGGRPFEVRQEQLAEVERLKAAGLTVREACRQVGVTRNQYYYNYKNPERVSVFVSNGL